MDITSAILDPELGRSAFTVERLTYRRTIPGTSAPSIVATVNPDRSLVSGDLSSDEISATGSRQSFARSQTYSALGCVHPGTPEMIQLLPEEERHEEFIAIYTDFALSLGADHGSTYTGPDRIHWNDKTWRVVRVRDWAMFGYYQCLAVMVHE